MTRIYAIATILWIAAGLRIVYDGSHPGAQPTQPVTPLSELPLDIVGQGWEGEKLTLSEAVETRAGVDDYAKHAYWSKTARFGLYVGYVIGFKSNAVHNPDVCNPGSGYELVAKNTVTIPAQGLETDLRFNEYTWRDPITARLVFTLSTFCYNGIFEPSEIRVRMNGWRANYFSVITLQGSFSGTEKETREKYYEVLRQSVPAILEHFPD